VEAEVEEFVAVAVVEVAFFLFLLGFFSFRAIYVPSCMRFAEQISATSPEKKHFGYTPQPHKASLCLHPMLLVGLLVYRSNVFNWEVVSWRGGGAADVWPGCVAFVFVFWLLLLAFVAFPFVHYFCPSGSSGSSQKSQRLVIVLRLNPFTILQMKYFGSRLIFTVQF
jgi:hypothetical protein